MLTLLFVDLEDPDQFDRERALTMALIHDLPEALLMDIPMPACDAYLREAKNCAEQEIMEKLMNGFSSKYADYNRDLDDPQTPEAKLVRGLDKAQMMLKIVMYEREGRGRLKEFWVIRKTSMTSAASLSPISSMPSAQMLKKPRPR